MNQKLLLLIIFLAALGLLDASYISWEQLTHSLPPCSLHWWVDCGKVLNSSYSKWWGVPVSFMGIIQYSLLLSLGFSLLQQWRQKISWWLLAQASLGFLFSLYFVFLQLFVIHAICLYCMVSALFSTMIFLTTLWLIKDKRTFSWWVLAGAYQGLKRIFFLFNPELVHEVMVHLGEALGSWPWLRGQLNRWFNPAYPSLTQQVAGITFATPIGLAAGFDYEARLTQVLTSLGFGFQSVGTISHHRCAGNPQPRLGRLPKSKALLVNKGFRNPGAKAVIHKLTPLPFYNPVGISVGQTNNGRLHTQTAVIEDILTTFRLFEKSQVKHQYYELNISCPNLHTKFNFYDPSNLDRLLRKVDRLKLTRPVFVKMPISESDATVLALLKVVAQHSPVGIIIGNLQKDRFNPAVVPGERQGLGPGNLSGKPTFERSNHLIALAYHHFHSKLVIIGCGGVFSPHDAYLKVKLGASLIQMITGLIFQGPQVVAQINQGLSELMKKDGYTKLSQAVGRHNAAYLKAHQLSPSQKRGRK